MRPEVDHAWHLYVIQLDDRFTDLTREALIAALKAERIGTSVHFIPLHLHPYYRSSFGYAPEDLSVATEAFARTVSLPIYPRMTDDDVDDVIDAVKRTVWPHRRSRTVAIPAGARD
jgi:dTDP-4-amino-4,6-dideoxygalactose transaminase